MQRQKRRSSPLIKHTTLVNRSIAYASNYHYALGIFFNNSYFPRRSSPSRPHITLNPSSRKQYQCAPSSHHHPPLPPTTPPLSPPSPPVSSTLIPSPPIPPTSPSTSSTQRPSLHLAQPPTTTSPPTSSHASHPKTTSSLAYSTKSYSSPTTRLITPTAVALREKSSLAGNGSCRRMGSCHGF